MAQERGDRDGREKHIERMIADLGLNEAQAKDFKAVWEEMKPGKKEKCAKPSHEEMEKKREEMDRKIKKILTDEQYKKFQEMKPQRGKPHGR